MGMGSLSVLRKIKRMFEQPAWVTNKTLDDWRVVLKNYLLKERGYRSDLSGTVLFKTGCHMHEGIISRAVVPLSVSWHFMIHHPYNCFLLLPDEHLPQAPSRGWAVEKAYERYGRENVRAWYYGLPWKAVPFQLP